jgi:LmbE family N-acetylglucosaminyl deacetylase
MLKLAFRGLKGLPLRILCLGSHSDDIEIGCGGTILQLLAEHTPLDVAWVVFSSGPKREAEARRSAALFLRGARRQSVITKDFRNGHFPSEISKIKEFFEELKREFSPDVIFTHYRQDLHQDHRTLCELTWNTFRNHMILEYEIPKYDGDLGTPNCFVHLDPRICKRKVQYLCKVFSTQREKHWFTPDTFEALLRLRGMESAAPNKYAEGFYGRKIMLNPSVDEFPRWNKRVKKR